MLLTKMVTVSMPVFKAQLAVKDQLKMFIIAYRDVSCITNCNGFLNTSCIQFWIQIEITEGFFRYSVIYRCKGEYNMFDIIVELSGFLTSCCFE